MSRTLIVGGGIAGLSAAFYLQEFSKGAANVTLIERSSRWGGKIATVREQGFLIEGGPDSFLTQKRAASDLCCALGLKPSLTGSNGNQRATTYVWSNGKLHPMPEGMMLMTPTMVLPFLRSTLISWPGKLRMGMEALIPAKKSGEDESLAHFVRRRLGREALDKIAAPLMAGIHSADPEKLSILSTFPMFPEMERTSGSLLRGMMRNKRDKAKDSSQKTSTSMFMTLQGGLGQLAEAIVDRLNPGSLCLNCSVKSVLPLGNGYRVVLQDGTLRSAGDVVLATPSYVTADLVEEMDPLLAALCAGFLMSRQPRCRWGFAAARLTILSMDLDSSCRPQSAEESPPVPGRSEKFPHRAPEDCVLLRVFAGGALAEQIAEQDDTSLLRLAREELQATMGIDATPIVAKVFRWPRAHPQYEVGHGNLIAAIEEALQAHPGLHLAGSAYRGAGIPDIIQSAMNVAKEIAGKRNGTQRAGAEFHVPVPA